MKTIQQRKSVYPITKTLTLATTVLMTLNSASYADNTHPHKVVPTAEKSITTTLQGPKKSEGIQSIKALASVSLAGEFKTIDDVNTKTLRAREIIVDPDGKVAVHRHDARPGIAYILEGEIWEYREGEPKPKRHTVGSVAFENTGVVHWWHNQSDQPAKALVIDIVPDEGS